jgi:hypothetical protein
MRNWVPFDEKRAEELRREKRKRFLKIADITPRIVLGEDFAAYGVNITVKIVDLQKPKEWRGTDKKTHRYLDALVADESGAMWMRIFDSNIEKVRLGETVKVYQCDAEYVMRLSSEADVLSLGGITLIASSGSEWNSPNRMEFTVYGGTEFGPAESKLVTANAPNDLSASYWTAEEAQYSTCRGISLRKPLRSLSFPRR